MLPEVITGFVNLTHCFCCRMWSCTVFDNSFEKMVTRSRVNYGHVTNVFFCVAARMVFLHALCRIRKQTFPGQFLYLNGR